VTRATISPTTAIPAFEYLVTLPGFATSAVSFRLATASACPLAAVSK